MIDFMCQIETLLLNMLKLLKISGFSSFLLKVSVIFFLISQIPRISRFFCLNCQISGFKVKWQPLFIAVYVFDLLTAVSTQLASVIM